MMQIHPRKLLVALTLLSMFLFHGMVRADFPDKPITLIVPYGPGSAIDAVARAIGIGAQKYLGQQVVIENKSGAGGALGAVYAGRRPADGYTLALVSINPFILSYFSKAMPLHPVDDFTQVISTSSYLMAVAVRADSKIKNMSDLVEQIKANPGKLTYSTAGIASTGYLNMEEFSALAKIKPVHVPYKSGAEAVSAVLAGHVDFFADAAWAPYQKDGRLRPLMIFANERSTKYPDIPIPTDLVKANVQQGYLMIVGPKNIPAPVLKRLHDAFKAATNEPEYKSVLDKFNMEPIYAGPEATRKATSAAMPVLENMFNTLGLGKQ